VGKFVNLANKNISTMSKEKKAKKGDFNYGTISDIEDNKYRTIKIESGILGANQEWFADNLNVSHFRNGDSILQAQECSDWLDACEKGIPAWCFYENNESFGKLYNLAAIMDPRGLAPEGFKIPNYIDFSILGYNAQEYEPLEKNIHHHDHSNRLADFGLSSGALKLMLKETWKKKSKNTCGLNIIGGGYRQGIGINDGFNGLNEICHIWLKPNGWHFMVNGGVTEGRDDSDSLKFGYGKDLKTAWIEFNSLKSYLPEFSVDEKNFFEAVISNGHLKIDAADYDEYYKALFLNGLQVDRCLLEKQYPFKKNDRTEAIYYNGAVSSIFEYFQTGRRGGIRIAAFASGKNHIWFSLADTVVRSQLTCSEGAYVRPFRYL
jgi:uncharacterized protein (TIGR02145 family)